MTREELISRIEFKISNAASHYDGCENEHLLCACWKALKAADDPPTVKEFHILAEIRAALGVGEKVMLGELLEKAREIKRNADRYKKVRKLTPMEFTETGTHKKEENT